MGTDDAGEPGGSELEPLRTWAEQGLLLFRDLLPLMAPVGQYAGWEAEERETLSFLLTACARASESALLLTAYGQLWDADVLVRSVWEGSLKFCYLQQERATFKVRHDEYSRQLFEISLLKKHGKAQELLKSVTDTTSRQWQPIRDLLLPPAELAEFSARYPQALRRSLETKWGFTGLLGELQRSGDAAFERIAGLGHTYAMASHVQHVDYIGASLPLERDRRSSERNRSIHLAHGARLISDVLCSLHIRLGIGYRFVKSDPTPLKVAWDQIEKLETTFGFPEEQWLDVEYPKSRTA